MTARYQPKRTVFRSWWLLAGRRIRITYNSRFHDWEGAAFLKLDVLEPQGGQLPVYQTAHASLVLRGTDKYRADRDHVAYVQKLLGLAAPAPQPRAGKPADQRQLPLF